MKDFAGNDLKLGDRVVTVKVGTVSFVSGEVIKLTPEGAKVATDPIMKDGQIWRNSKVLQRASWVIHLVEHNPIREAELSPPAVQSI